ncbi:MAG: hypothetical protein ACOYL6_09460 [Bacteriovoracaceae bacterium]
MTLQHSILVRFREHYPQASFKEIAELTGIQSTRVFRLFNGFEMKLKEYAQIENVLAQKSHASIDKEFLQLTQELLSHLSSHERKYFHLYLQRELHKKELKMDQLKNEVRSQYV